VHCDLADTFRKICHGNNFLIFCGGTPAKFAIGIVVPKSDDENCRQIGDVTVHMEYLETDIQDDDIQNNSY
jgi:hypothetical protein